MKVLIMTGGLVTGAESSRLSALRRILLQWRASRHAWLDLKIKLVFAELLLWSGPRGGDDDRWAPDLTEVLLATLLRRAGMEYEVATYAELFDRPRRIDKLLQETDCVFFSTTFLRDLSEVTPLVARLKRPHNRIVLGGPLAGLLADRWEGMPELSVLAAGYGEFLVPALADWIRSGFTRLTPPAGGRVVVRGATTVLYSGLPDSRSLDDLPTPDWAQSARDRGRRYRMIYYESVRGCPYRCNFCNYPFLFTDTRFRHKSAPRMLAEWEHYVAELGVEYITCLDSLFTVPRPRLQEFCRGLIERRLPVKWVCYARADDLADEATTALMKAAGAWQVQIGVESGSQQQLDNMDKACTVEANGRAIDNCRRHGITTVTSLIVGFPGETADTLAVTLDFLRRHPPDFFFLAPFSTRATGVPLLSAENRQRFDLRTADALSTGAPYWRHRTMSCDDVGNRVRAMHRTIMDEDISLHAALFHDRLLTYVPSDRARLFEEQRGVLGRARRARWLFDGLNALVDRRLRRDVARWVDQERNIPRGGGTVRRAPA